MSGFLVDYNLTILFPHQTRLTTVDARLICLATIESTANKRQAKLGNLRTTQYRMPLRMIFVAQGYQTSVSCLSRFTTQYRLFSPAGPVPPPPCRTHPPTQYFRQQHCSSSSSSSSSRPSQALHSSSQPACTVPPPPRPLHAPPPPPQHPLSAPEGCGVATAL